MRRQRVLVRFPAYLVSLGCQARQLVTSEAGWRVYRTARLPGSSSGQLPKSRPPGYQQPVTRLVTDYPGNRANQVRIGEIAKPTTGLMANGHRLNESVGP